MAEPRRLDADELTRFKDIIENSKTTVEKAAVEIGINPGSIRNVLKETGYRVERVRKVVAITPVPLLTRNSPQPKKPS